MTENHCLFDEKHSDFIARESRGHHKDMVRVLEALRLLTEEVRELREQLKPKKRVYKAPVASEAFKSFWNYYPRKVGRPAALKAWNGLNELDKHKVISVIPDWVDGWRGKNKKHIPHPSTWLNQHRFNDDVDDALPEPEPKKMGDDEFTKHHTALGNPPRPGESIYQYRDRIETT